MVFLDKNVNMDFSAAQPTPNYAYYFAAPNAAFLSTSADQSGRPRREFRPLQVGFAFLRFFFAFD